MTPSDVFTYWHMWMAYMQWAPMGSLSDSGHARAVMHAGIANPRWRGKRSRHSRCTSNPQICGSGKRPMLTYIPMRHVHVARTLSGLQSDGGEIMCPTMFWCRITWVCVCLTLQNWTFKCCNSALSHPRGLFLCWGLHFEFLISFCYNRPS